MIDLLEVGNSKCIDLPMPVPKKPIHCPISVDGNNT